jgi:hypothetical protein
MELKLEVINGILRSILFELDCVIRDEIYPLNLSYGSNVEVG